MMQKNPYDQFDQSPVPPGMPPGSIMVAAPPAANVYDAPQAAANLTKTNQQIGIDAAGEQRAREDAERRRQAFAADLYSKGLRLGANGQPEPIPNWVNPTKHAESQPLDMGSVRAEALDKIKLARSLQQRSKNGWFTTGFGSGAAAWTGGTPAYDVAQDTETLKNAGALTRIMEMAKANGGKNPLTPLSNSDFQALASSLSNLDPRQSDDQYQRNVQRVIDLYARAYQGAGGTDLEKDLRVAGGSAPPPPVGETSNSFTPTDVVDFAAGLSGGKYDFDATGHLTYNGQPASVSADVINSPQYREAYKARFGEFPRMRVDIGGGQQGELEQRRDTIPGGIDATIRGAADTLTSGLADPLAAGVRSAFNDDGYAANLARERAISTADEEVNPLLRMGGQIAGVVPAFTNLSRIGAGLTPARPYLGAALADTAGGAVYGAASNLEKDPVASALVGGATALVGNQIGQRIISPTVERALARYTGQSNPVARALAGTKDVDLDAARGTLVEARELGLPMSLADSDPRFRVIAGSATRLSPSGREVAERIVEPRGRARGERAIAAIERDFGPAVNVRATGDDLISGGREASSPLYREAYASPVVSTPEIEALLATPAGKAALSRARTIAANERRDPSGLGFELDRDGNVVLHPVELASFQRHAEAQIAFDAAQDAHRTALRTSGADTNATRGALLGARDDLQEATAALTSRPAAGTAAPKRGYTTQTLDYVKRGLDDILEERRDKVTGRLVLDEYLRSVNKVRGELVDEVDRLNPRYREARQAYQGPARQKDALTAGYDAVGARTRPDAITQTIDRLPPDELERFRAGYRTGMVDQIEGAGFGRDPYAMVWGTPHQIAKAEALFPENAGRFARQAEMERQLAKTQHEVLGGSPTAARRAADEQFGPAMGVQLAGETALGLATGTPPISAITRAARATLGDRMRFGIGGQREATSVAEALLNSSPNQALSMVDAIIAQELMRSQSLAIGGSAGAATTIPVLASLGAE